MARKKCKPCDGRGWRHEDTCPTMDKRFLHFMEVDCTCQRPTCVDCNGSGIMVRHRDRV